MCTARSWDRLIICHASASPNICDSSSRISCAHCIHASNSLWHKLELCWECPLAWNKSFCKRWATGCEGHAMVMATSRHSDSHRSNSRPGFRVLRLMYMIALPNLPRIPGSLVLLVCHQRIMCSLRPRPKCVTWTFAKALRFVSQVLLSCLSSCLSCSGNQQSDVQPAGT